MGYLLDMYITACSAAVFASLLRAVCSFLPTVRSYHQQIGFECEIITTESNSLILKFDDQQPPTSDSRCLRTWTKSTTCSCDPPSCSRSVNLCVLKKRNRDKLENCSGVRVCLSWRLGSWPNLCYVCHSRRRVGLLGWVRSDKSWFYFCAVCGSSQLTQKGKTHITITSDE